MPGKRTANFEDICADGNLLNRIICHLMSTICLVISQQGRRLNVLKSFQFSKESDVAISDIICLDEFITATIDLVKKNASEMVQQNMNEMGVHDFEPPVEEKEILNCPEEQREDSSKQRPNKHFTRKAVEFQFI